MVDVLGPEKIAIDVDYAIRQPGGVHDSVDIVGCVLLKNNVSALPTL